MNSSLKKRVNKLRGMQRLDSPSGFIFVSYEDGRYHIKKQDHAPKFIETKRIAKFKSKKESKQFLGDIADGYTIFWDIFPEKDN